jgi:hypothetical protein
MTNTRARALPRNLFVHTASSEKSLTLLCASLKTFAVTFEELTEPKGPW